ncbi:MAG: aldehyde ferredoxin oxidoreductase family protein [Anaerolineae bacterium]
MAGSGRSAVGAKSPLTGTFGGAEAGGWFGAELRAAGFDAVVIRGRSAQPVYLWIKDGEAEIRPAGHLWGLLTADVQAAIRQELGDARVRVAQIGPAGERLAPIACIMHDINRAAGRGGLGAVMGSKNLKALAVRGSGKLPLADAEALRSLNRYFSEHWPHTWGPDLHDKGTSAGVPGQNACGGLPTHNFQQGTFAGFEDITGERMRDTILIERDTCYACPVRCKRVVQVREGPFPVDPVYGGPEYETIGALGSTCGVSDLAAVARANQLCNAYGLDTISTGVSIAWAMECSERGLLTPEDTGGAVLRFGDAAAMVRLVEQIGVREGFGRLLGEGSRRAARTIGRGTEAYAMQAKGLEVPMHEPRVKYALGLAYALSPTGADHNHAFHDSDYTNDEGIAGVRPFGILQPLPYDDMSPAKMRLAKVEIHWATANNVLGLCGFVYSMYERPKIAEMLQAVTGWQTSLYEVLQAGERAYNMARAFNAREGFTADDDRIPHRYFEGFVEGPSAGNRLDPEAFAQARELMYAMMGWEERSGAPAAWKLHELGIGWVADLLAHGLRL